MKKFDEELHRLRDNVLHMGGVVQSMLNDVVAALATGDTAVAKQVYSAEQSVDQLELDVDHEALRLLTVYQPVAIDLRFIMATARITQELERIADQTVNMCEYLELIAAKADVPCLNIVRKEAEMASDMLADSLTAYTEKDCDKAMVVIRSDNRVDALNDQILQEILGGTEPRSSQATALAVILISRSLERIGDQCTNLCEEVVYLAKGDDIRHPKLTANPGKTGS